MKKILIAILAMFSLLSCQDDFREIRLKPSEVWLYVEGQPTGELVTIYSESVIPYEELKGCGCEYVLDVDFDSFDDIPELEEKRPTKIFEGCGSSEFVYVTVGDETSIIEGFKPEQILVVTIKFEETTGEAIVDYQFHDNVDEYTHIDLNN